MRNLQSHECGKIAGGDATNTTTTDPTTTTTTPSPSITIPNITIPSITITAAEIDDIIDGVQDVAKVVEEQINNSHPNTGTHHPK